MSLSSLLFIVVSSIAKTLYVLLLGQENNAVIMAGQKSLQCHEDETGPNFGYLYFSLWLRIANDAAIEQKNINAFEIWYWRRINDMPWSAMRSNRCILELYFGHIVRQLNDNLDRLMVEGNEHAAEHQVTVFSGLP